MDEMETRGTELIVAALEALRLEMTVDLDDLQERIRAFQEEGENGTGVPEHMTADRTALHSGIASIREVLGWLSWMVERDPDGATAVAAQPLPSTLGLPIH